MAHNFQNSTLSFTLPISCQICLGKVRQPVICANHHVFCAACMEMWLQKAGQCPTCRVPITAENPCREIIGGTNENEHSESPSVRKRLRKTRGELLLREYEDEIEGLVRENEELKTKNQNLESHLKTALDPSSIITVQTEDKRVDPGILEEWANKLQAATDVCNKIKQDMDKLKEANKTLRSQNVDLVQENMRLKAEVASRSPQKFGRYTVAALEAKIQQYERDVDHLKRALDRSDQYIEDLESRVSERERRQPEMQGACQDTKVGTDTLMEQQRINIMRSLSDTERESICSNPKAKFGNDNLIFPSFDNREFDEKMVGHQKEKDLESSFLPSTPSSAFRSLTLRSPGIREKKVAFKPMSYLRRLNFEETPSLGNSGSSSSATENQFSSLTKFPNDLPPSTEMEPPKSVFWGAWQRPKCNDQACPGPSKGATSKNLLGSEPDSFQMSSEASMDAAYLDKISELDSMMLDGESSSSRGSQLSLASSPPTDLDATLIPEPKTCSVVLTDCGDAVMGGRVTLSSDHESHPPCDIKDSTLKDTVAPAGSAEDQVAGQVLGQEAGTGAHIQTDELSFDLLFDPLEENKAGSFVCQHHDHHVNPSSLSSSCACKPGNTRDRKMVNVSQPTKRKSHSPFNTSSPTKLSKLM
ncbi:RING finger protein 219 [Myripristis murdjan]|uniref:RING-type domain-containing protein n=1 Tax=Myripristis murdjan TaxID=586833 RepID=A0A667XRJ3_9TELE|nr:RING finger protein 219 [Myripristis murdjan]